MLDKLVALCLARALGMAVENVQYRQCLCVRALLICMTQLVTTGKKGGIAASPSDGMR